MPEVDMTNLNVYYSTTTPGTTIQSGPIDPALQSLVVAINDNYALFQNLINAFELPILDQSIVTRHIRNQAITNPKYAQLSITADKIEDGSITLSKIQDLVITAAKIANGTITEPKYETGSVSSRAIAASSIKTIHLDPSILFPLDTSIQAEFDKRGVNVQKFGAKGDGVTDDTAAIQATIEYAYGIQENVIVPPGNYVVSSILLKNGLKGFIGIGATLTANTSFSKVINTTTNNLDLSQQVNNCVIKGFTINMNGIASMGIHIYGRNNKVSNCYVYGAKTGSQLVRITYDSYNNHVFNCTLISLIDEPFGTYTDMSCVIVEGKQYNSWAGLNESDEVIPGTNTSYDNKIYNNYCEGGTHTIGLRQAERTLVEGNTIKRGSHRGIVLSPYACYNLITNNSIYECGSSGIHMAYGSSENIVTNNSIINLLNPAIAGLTGEGAIQAYIHTKNNYISDNKIISRYRYGIYTGIHSDGTVIENNFVDGGTRCCIAVSSEWSSPLATGESYDRPNYSAPDNPAWTSWDNGKGLHNIVVSNNKIKKYVSNDNTVRGAGIYIGQGKVSVLDSLSVRGNRILGYNNGAEDLYVYVNDPTKFMNITISDNDSFPNQPLRNVFTNQNTNLINYQGNSWQNQTISITAARIDANNLIDVSVYGNYFITVTPATIAGFKGATCEGREINLRLNPNITLVHSSLLKLKGNTNVTTPSTANDNLIMKFVYISGGWLESSRNF
ncbi:right-handed parallel beta-helix repeat-containing protein [Paenibacillus sp. FSL L8-0323]|uniref:NosD domain-containing protein n=1 Tax=Paenibacillus sp. FSL L8-0323 TaxID=2975330 RepID=UPI0030F4CB9D